MGKQVFIKSIPRDTASKIHEFRNGSSGKKLNKTKLSDRCKDGYQALFSLKTGGLKTGPGLRQILRDGHIEYYSGNLTEQRLVDYLMDIFWSRVDEQNRKVTVMTGTGGSIMFHDMLAASSRAFLQVDTNCARCSGFDLI